MTQIMADIIKEVYLREGFAFLPYTKKHRKGMEQKYYGALKRIEGIGILSVTVTPPSLDGAGAVCVEYRTAQNIRHHLVLSLPE